MGERASASASTICTDLPPSLTAASVEEEAQEYMVVPAAAATPVEARLRDMTWVGEVALTILEPTRKICTVKEPVKAQSQ